MSEEQKVDNRKLAGWKRAILIAVPFVLLGLAILFMVKGITAWGPDFTRNHGDSYLTLGLICTILLFIGIAMQFVWPKAINRGRRIVVVGLVFNIILAISGAIVIGVGYGINDSKYQVFETKYTEMTKYVREGLSSEHKSETIAPGVTVEQFIKDFGDFTDKNSGGRAIYYNVEEVTSLKTLTPSTFVKQYGYDCYAVESERNIGKTLKLYNLYMGDADLKAFANKYGFKTTEYLYESKSHSDDDAPQYYEALWSERNNHDASKTVKVHFDYGTEIDYVNSFTSKLTSSTAARDTYENTFKKVGVNVLFDINAKAARVQYFNSYGHWYTYIDK